MNDQPILDRDAFGRLLRAARIIAGYDRVEDAVAAIHETAAVDMSERTLYALERGEQEPTAAQFLAVIITFEPPSGAVYWFGCFRPDIRAYFIRSRSGPS